ncbi:unnamed protein product [Gulo gulo]|uniref:Uncharacterized protein n=1 Tax=Gulo gulo TaxID=48420 RepID=A0A9X9LCU7_GULGU|nr:unnamed protein product [Gulo gulo]
MDGRGKGEDAGSQSRAVAKQVAVFELKKNEISSNLCMNGQVHLDRCIYN